MADVRAHLGRTVLEPGDAPSAFTVHVEAMPDDGFEVISYAAMRRENQDLDTEDGVRVTRTEPILKLFWTFRF